MNRRRVLPVLLCAIAFSGLCAQAGGGNREQDGAFENPGDPAVAERYFLWAEQAAAEGRWPEALSALERAADFADLSSDLSFLLALARSRGGKSRQAVLEALERALEANRWGRYTPVRARLLEAEQLIALRGYSAALAALDQVPDSADAAALRLAALKGLCADAAPPAAEFRRRMSEALDRYPRDPRLPRIFFEYARNRNPGGGDQPLMDTVLRRLPFMLETDPDLAWMAAPFIRDTEEARRLVAAYRAGGYGPARNGNFRPSPASIAAALNLGLIGGEDAAGELFPPDEAPVIDKDLLIEVSDLLRDEAGRKRFAEKLLAFSGTITADNDRDGYPESRACYVNGTLREYGYDADQDGVAELVVSFDSGGVPQRAEQQMSGPAAERTTAAGRMTAALILWERYPSVLRVELAGGVFIPRPGDFQFAPFSFIDLAGGGGYSGLPFPRQDGRAPRLTERTLVSFAITIQRPSAEFEGAVERIDLDRGVPLRAVEILNGQPVSVTEFENGRPVLQRLDLDLDGRMETLRRFRALEYDAENPLGYKKIVQSSESDWNGDGVYETAETFREDGSLVYSWDMDGDGIREYSESR